MMMDLGFRLIQSFPILQTYGKIEELFIDLKKRARRIDTVEAGQ